MSGLFRDLDPSEQAAFRAAARATYVPFTEICGCWHPIFAAECVAINAELGAGFDAEAAIAVLLSDIGE